MNLIIHHWDTDGICSGGLLYTESCEVMTPTIGNYFLTEEELENIARRAYESITVADMALHETSLRELVKIAPVKVFDHHLSKKIDGITYVNPIVDGVDQEKYPSASWVISTHLHIQNNLLSYLGAVGDWEERLKTTAFYPLLQDFMKTKRLDFEQLHEMIKLLDANYKVGNKAAVQRAVVELAEADDTAQYILKNDAWRQNKEKIDIEIARSLESPEELRGSIKLKKMDSPYNIISTIARQSWDKKSYVIVSNCGYFKNDCQVYVRGSNCLPLIKHAVEKGLVAGGKQNVLGAIVPKNDVEGFIEDMIKLIEG